MNPVRLVGLLPLAYIVWWICALFFNIIPMLNVGWAQITAWTIVATILFFAGGIILLVICVFFVGVFFFAG